MRLIAYAGTAVVRPQSVTVDPRSIVRIPIITSITENVRYDGIRPLEAIIEMDEHHFLAQSIEVRGGSGEILSQEFAAGRRRIRLRVERSFSRQDTAIWLVGPAGIGQQDSSIMLMDSTADAFGKAVATTYASALLRIANPDPTRHLRFVRGPIIGGVFPNPASDNVAVGIRSEHASQARLRVVDAQGLVVSDERLDLVGGENQHTLDVQLLRSGAYRIVLDSDGHVSSSPLTVIR